MGSRGDPTLKGDPQGGIGISRGCECTTPVFHTSTHTSPSNTATSLGSSYSKTYPCDGKKRGVPYRRTHMYHCMNRRRIARESVCARFQRPIYWNAAPATPSRKRIKFQEREKTYTVYDSLVSADCMSRTSSMLSILERLHEPDGSSDDSGFKAKHMQ